MKSSFNLRLLIALLVTSLNAAAQPGTLDPNFDGNGIVIQDMGASFETASSLMTQNGKLVATSSISQGSGIFGVIRMNLDGSLDNTFGVNGQVLADPGLLGTTVTYAGLILPDGKILQAGYGPTATTIGIVAARYNVNGFLDNSFGPGGWQEYTLPTANLALFGLALQADGKVVGSGVHEDASGPSIMAIRFNADGTLDNTFSFDGIATITVGTGGNMGWDLAIQPDGKIVVVGEAYMAPSVKHMVITRFNPDGSIDLNFGTNGLVTIDYGNQENSAQGVEIMGDGKIQVGGQAILGSDDVMTVARLNPDGSLDAAYGTSGLQSANFPVGHALAYDMVVQPDGKAIVVGRVDNGSDYDLAMARFDASGNLDPTFNGTGMVVTDVGGANDLAFAGHIQDDGLILISGNTATPTGTDLVVARYISGVNMSIGDVETYIGSTIIYPNPIINNNITVEYELKESQHISIDLFDISGKQVAQLQPRLLVQKGSHRKAFTMPDVSAGKFIVRLTTSQGSVAVQLSVAE